MHQVFWGQPEDDSRLEEETGVCRTAFGCTGGTFHPSQAHTPHDHGSPGTGLHPAVTGRPSPFRQGEDQTFIGPALPRTQDPLARHFDNRQDHHTAGIVFPEKWPGLSRSGFKMGSKLGKKTPATHTGALCAAPHRRRPLADGYDDAGTGSTQVIFLLCHRCQSQAGTLPAIFPPQQSQCQGLLRKAAKLLPHANPGCADR